MIILLTEFYITHLFSLSPTYLNLKLLGLCCSSCLLLLVIAAPYSNSHFLAIFSSYTGIQVISISTAMSKKDLINVSFLSRPTLGFQDHIHECQTAPSEDGKLQEKEQKHEQEEDQKGEIELSSLELVRRPSLGEFREAGEDDDDNDDDDDGFRTPTSLDNRMPLIPQCPPAPRKPKSLSLTKRKADGGLRILLDLSNEIESLFPPAFLGDLGGKIKKLRKVNGTE